MLAINKLKTLPAKASRALVHSIESASSAPMLIRGIVVNAIESLPVDVKKSEVLDTLLSWVRFDFERMLDAYGDNSLLAPGFNAKHTHNGWVTDNPKLGYFVRNTKNAKLELGAGLKQEIGIAARRCRETSIVEFLALADQKAQFKRFSKGKGKAKGKKLANGSQGVVDKLMPQLLKAIIHPVDSDGKPNVKKFNSRAIIEAQFRKVFGAVDIAM